MKKLMSRLLGWDDGEGTLLPEYVPNADLTPGMIPPRDAPWDEIARFSLTFDGCWRKGSFNRCADVPCSREGRTLSEMRACLSHELKGVSSQGRTPGGDTETFVRDLLEQMRAAVIRGEKD